MARRPMRLRCSPDGLTSAGRREMARRIEAGTAQAEVARQMHLLRGTVAKLWGRWCNEGEAG